MLSVVDPLTDPDAAVMVVVPPAMLVARPDVLIVAIAMFDDVQTALLVTSLTLLSLNVPVALNCCVPPTRIDALAGVTAMEASVAGPTTKIVEPVIRPDVALIVVVPWLTPVARPAGLIVATPSVVELHVTGSGRVCLLPSLKIPVAVNC